MYGLIGCIRANPGTGARLVEILGESTEAMPGCISYVVAVDSKDTDAIWVTEVWDSPESHTASLALKQVQDAIARARPLIAGFDSHVETRPISIQSGTPAP